MKLIKLQTIEHDGTFSDAVYVNPEHVVSIEPALSRQPEDSHSFVTTTAVTSDGQSPSYAMQYRVLGSPDEVAARLTAQAQAEG